MKAIRVHEFGGPEVLRLEDLPNPSPSSPGQIVVQVKAAGVNPVDTYVRAGTYAFKPPLPYTPGMDAAGVVESVGQGVTRAKEGDRVYLAGTITGSYAEKTVCTEAQVHQLPQKITFTQGAGINIPYATAYRALFQIGQARPAEIVFVHGASGGVGPSAPASRALFQMGQARPAESVFVPGAGGGVGTAARQLARAAGLTVIGTA